MGNPQRPYVRQLMLTLFDKEATYDAGPAGWTAGSACSMLDFEDSVQDEWPDELGSNEGQIGRELMSRQEIVRQSARIPYADGQVKPNTAAGLIALALGTVTSAQDALLTAYRHKVVKAVAYSLPSIAAQLKHEGGAQYKYSGIKSEGFTLARNKDYIRFNCPLLGSGTRATASDSFTASISENPFLWRNAKSFVKVVSSAISIPAAPTQGAANLGGSEVDLSTEMLDLNIDWKNNLEAVSGYRLGSAVRQMLHAGRRAGSVKFSLQADQSTESTRLGYYLNQSKIAFELNVDSGTIIAATGTFKFGMIVVVPQMQIRPLGKSVKDGYEALDFEGTIMDDGTNSEIVAWVYNAQAAYLV